MKKPELKFSKWFKWYDRENYEFKKFPGVYAISRSKTQLEGKEFDWNTDIIYIGMSNDKNGIIKRWNFFDNAICGKKGNSHGAGNRIRKEFGSYDNWREELYVAAHTIKCNPKSRTPDDLISMGLVAFKEYAALAEFKKRFNREPIFIKR